MKSGKFSRYFRFLTCTKTSNCSGLKWNTLPRFEKCFFANKPAAVFSTAKLVRLGRYLTLPGDKTTIITKLSVMLWYVCAPRERNSCGSNCLFFFFCISAITQCRSKFSPGFQRNFQKFSYAQVDRLGAPYDLNSLMHLYRMSWSKNGKNTIEARAGAGIPLGTKQGLSDIDRQQLNQLYRCGGYKGRPCW